MGEAARPHADRLMQIARSRFVAQQTAAREVLYLLAYAPLLEPKQ